MSIEIDKVLGKIHELSYINDYCDCLLDANELRKWLEGEKEK